LKYLITGGAGFVGSHVVDALIARGDSVIVLDDLSTGAAENIDHVLGSDQVEFVQGVTHDEALVDDCMASADVCIHLASAVGVQLVVDRALDSLMRNVRGTDIVLSAAARHRRRVLFASTSEVYGKNSDGPLDEDADRIVGSPFKCRWGYATAKAFGEAMAHGLYRERGIETIVVRLFNTVGARQTGQYGMVLPRFVRQALAGNDLTVYGNGTQTRCFTHVDDVTHALLLLLDHDDSPGRVFNIGSSTPVAVVELARRVIERTDSESKVVLVPYDQAYGEGFEELGRRVPDTGAVRGLTGWRTTRTVDDAIDDVIAYEQTVRSAFVPLRVAG
jgi:UDP-glucose 4-epimerase